MSRDSGAGFFTGLLIGAVIGLALGFLYAPQEGQETRRLFREKAAGMRDAANRASQKIRGAADSKLKREE